MTDKHFLIRNLAIEHFEILNKHEIEQLLKDKSARVRLHTLYKLKDDSDFENIIWDFIADSSGRIRHLARFTLKDKVSDFGAIYNQNLNDNKQIIGSLTGLAEIDAKKYSETAIKFLTNNKVKVRKIAFLALRKLDEEIAYNFAYSNLDSHFSGIRNVSIDFLSLNLRTEVLEKARSCFKAGKYDIKLSMLKLFNKIGGWSAIPDLILGTIDNDDNIRQLSYKFIQNWKMSAIRLFTTPKQGEMERAKKILKYTNGIHKDKKYFETNPLEGFEFYIK